MRDELKSRAIVHLRRPSNNLFGNKSRGDATPQEIDSPIEEKLNESPNPIKCLRSSSEATPITVCKQITEENFMFDSLDNQEDYPVITNGGEEKGGLESEFMRALQSAIHHFEKPMMVPREVKSSMNKSRAGNGQSPTLSNFTTSNSFNEREDSTEALKKQYNELLTKYNSLKTSSKTLIKDFAILRSQYEEVNAVSLVIILV
jgi:hypothetical protein